MVSSHGTFQNYTFPIETFASLGGEDGRVSILVLFMVSKIQFTIIFLHLAKLSSEVSVSHELFFSHSHNFTAFLTGLPSFINVISIILFNNHSNCKLASLNLTLITLAIFLLYLALFSSN